MLDLLIVILFDLFMRFLGIDIDNRDNDNNGDFIYIDME